MLGKAGLSEDVLEADCTFFKVLKTFLTHESSQILYVYSCRELLQEFGVLFGEFGVLFLFCFV